MKTFRCCCLRARLHLHVTNKNDKLGVFRACARAIIYVIVQFILNTNNIIIYNRNGRDLENWGFGGNIYIFLHTVFFFDFGKTCLGRIKVVPHKQMEIFEFYRLNTKIWLQINIEILAPGLRNSNAYFMDGWLQI